ncbi:MAG: DUF4253 domain-containing protein [Nitrospirota bacterium]|nr:DUF4253 domain-containing protein [Nitrospirota bacterium]
MTGLRAFMVLFGLLFLFSRFTSAEPAVLTPAEAQLAVQVCLEREIVQIVKEESKSALHRLSGYDEKGFQIMARGIVVSVPESRTEQVLASLRTRLSPLHGMAFIVDINEAIKTDRIGIIKGTDQYDILRIMYTNGEEDDVSHDEVIEKLKAWEKRFPFDIIGAEHDWVELQFRTLPMDVKSFADDVYDFCPDAVDEDLGTVVELVKDLKATKRLYLWWE